MLSLGRRTQLRTGAVARVAFTLLTLLLVSAREARAQSWADARAHDKGCRDGAHIFHVRCERSDQDWSDRCSDMPKRQFRGSTMTKDPVRLPDRAWTEVAVADGVCGPLPASQGNVGVPDWADGLAHDKGCRGYAHLFHVRCERPDGSWSTECADMPKRLFRGIEMAGDPVRLTDKAWTEVIITDGTCEPLSTETAKGRCRQECDDMLKSAVIDAFGNVGGSGESGSEVGVALVACQAYCDSTRHADLASLNWYEKWAVAKECAGVNRLYHIPCTDGDGVWASARDKDRCPGFPNTMKGQPLAKQAEDLTGNLLLVWKSFEIPDDSCKMDWADARAHDKGCRGTSHIFHVRCERPDGSWSQECTDMSTRSFRNNAMTTAPVRLPDRAWTEVAITDATCNPQAVTQVATPPVPPTSTTTTTTTTTTPQDAGSSPPSKRQRPPSTTTTTTATAANKPSAPSACWAYLNGPNIWLNNAAQSYPESVAGPLCLGKEDSTKPAECYHILASGQIAWDVKGLSGTKPNDYTRWASANMIKVCRGSNTGTVLAQCVEGRVAVHMDWSEATQRCRVGQAD